MLKKIENKEGPFQLYLRKSGCVDISSPGVKKVRFCSGSRGKL